MEGVWGCADRCCDVSLLRHCCLHPTDAVDNHFFGSVGDGNLRSPVGLGNLVHNVAGGQREVHELILGVVGAVSKAWAHADTRRVAIETDAGHHMKTWSKHGSLRVCLLAPVDEDY